MKDLVKIRDKINKIKNEKEIRNSNGLISSLKSLKNKLIKVINPYLILILKKGKNKKLSIIQK